MGEVKAGDSWCIDITAWQAATQAGIGGYGRGQKTERGRKTCPSGGSWLGAWMLVAKGEMAGEERGETSNERGGDKGWSQVRIAPPPEVIE